MFASFVAKQWCPVTKTRVYGYGTKNAIRPVFDTTITVLWSVLCQSLDDTLDTLADELQVGRLSQNIASQLFSLLSDFSQSA